MKISRLMDILKEYNEKYGDVEITGTCASCQKMELVVSVVTDDFNKTVEIVFEEDWGEDEDE